MRRGEENQRQGGGGEIKSDSRIYTPEFFLAGYKYLILFSVVANGVDPDIFFEALSGLVISIYVSADIQIVDKREAPLLGSRVTESEGHAI